MEGAVLSTVKKFLPGNAPDDPHRCGGHITTAQNLPEIAWSICFASKMKNAFVAAVASWPALFLCKQALVFSIQVQSSASTFGPQCNDFVFCLHQSEIL